MRALELLAPARDAHTARQAILHGADAVYIGAGSHGARASASNDIADIAALVDFAHLYGARVYVTVNTIVYDSEIAAVRRLVRDIYRAGADALIVQDMSLLRIADCPIDMHASTQCDIRTPQKARFLADCGFTQLVLPREFSLDEIRAVRRAVPDDVALEAFVHGALCVSYSGDCQAGFAACRRSANRGECPQICRLPYSLTDKDGNPVSVDGKRYIGKHLLSLRDLCRLDDIAALADAGVSSFKIEGRLKDPAYVKHTVAAYRRAIDRLIADHPDRYCRPSWGRESISFTPDVNAVFNRGFTRYFIDGIPVTAVGMSSMDTPKWIGMPVGKVKAVKGKSLIATLDTELHNGDGLGFFGSDGTYRGFRLNRIDGCVLFPAPGDNNAWREALPGTILYRNSDVKSIEETDRDTATRLIDVDMRLSVSDVSDTTGECTLSLLLTTPHGHRCCQCMPLQASPARSPQADSRRRALTKTGGTPFTVAGYTDTVPADLFIPASALSALRRDAIALLERTIIATYPYRYRRPEDPSAPWPESAPLTYHDNVANDVAETFYRDHGAEVGQRALEVTGRSTLSSPLRVMTTRYCLRRELGACLRDPAAIRIPGPLYLSASGTRYRLDFDCAECRMHVTTD